MNEPPEPGSAVLRIDVPKVWVKVVAWGIAAWFGIHVLDVILTVILHANGWWPF